MNNMVLEIKRTKKNVTILVGITLLFFLFFLGHASAAIMTYDNFSDGLLSTTRWAINDPLNAFSIASGSGMIPPQPYVLRASGTGDSTFPSSNLITKPDWHTFAGNFGAAINFFNFSYSGPNPGQSDPRTPSISLIIGDWDTNNNPSSNYFTIARAVNPLGQNIIGWRQRDKFGNTIIKGGVPYGGVSGGLVVDYEASTHTLNLGYFSSPDASTWDEPTIIQRFSDVSFAGDPRLMIALAPGGTGSSTTAFVGGLYYDHEVSTVPVPPAVWLLGSGLIGLAGLRRRWKK